MSKKNFKNKKRTRIQRHLNGFYKLEEKAGLNEGQCEYMYFLSGQIMENEKEIYDIYKNVAKNTGFSVEEIKQRMKQPVDFMPYIVEEIPSYEDQLVFWLKAIKNSMQQ